MNNKWQKHIVLSIISFTEKIKKKILEFFKSRSDPESVSDPDQLFPEVDPDPDQNEGDPQHCKFILKLYQRKDLTWTKK